MSWTKCNGKIWGKDYPGGSIYVNSFAGPGGKLYSQHNINGWMIETHGGEQRFCAASNDWGWAFTDATRWH